MEYTYEVTEYLEGEKLIMQTAQGPFPMKTIYTWEGIENDRTVMKLTNQGQPSGFSKLTAPLMSNMMKKANQKDLRTIKEVLENM